MTRGEIEPRLGRRLQRIYRLSDAPKTVREFTESLREQVAEKPQMVLFIESVRKGKAAIGQTSRERGYSIVEEDGRTQVSCAYDALATASLRGNGDVEAECPHCGERMELSVRDGVLLEMSPLSSIFWLGAPPRDAPGNPVCDHLPVFPGSPRGMD